MTITRRTRAVVLAAAIAGGVGLNVERAETHKPITSKYTYNEDVFPILRDRCGRCHVPDGVAPMSLMTYKDAVPWGESIRAEIIAGHMPPWHVRDGAVRFKNAPAITAADIDKILVWVSGGNPEGNPQNGPPPVALSREWPNGKPDLIIPLPEAALPSDQSDIMQEFTVPTRSTEPQWVRAADLLAGTSSIVRSATVAVREASEAPIRLKPDPTDTKPDSVEKLLTEVPPERLLAAWVPGETPVDVAGAAFRLPAGADLIVRVHYKKTYAYEGRAMTDRSAVGLYFARGPAMEIRRFALASTPTTATRDSVSFSRTADQNLQALAFRPDPSLSNASLQVDAVTASGVRTRVIQLAVRPDWTRRYWFEQPLAVPRGTRLEVVAVLNAADKLLPPSGTPLPAQAVDGKPISVAFDVIPAR